MKWMRFVLPVVVLAGGVLPAQAQLFGRRVRLNGMQAPELIVTARTDQDERRRMAAVQQLRDLDLRAYPDIVPGLIDVLFKDPSSAVRMEAVHALGRMPRNPMIGQALVQSAHQDGHWRVRFQAKTQAWMNGYHGNGNQPFVPPAVPTTNEPPLGAIAVPPPPPRPLSLPPAPQPISIGTPPPLIESPMPVVPNPNVPRPLPSRPINPLVPQPSVSPPPVSQPPSDEPPVIIPPSPTPPQP